ncbi:MAG: FAD:protein FMN transferase [bacterium]
MHVARRRSGPADQLGKAGSRLFARLVTIAAASAIAFALRPVTLSAQPEPLYEVSATKYLLGTKIDFLGTHPSITGCKQAFTKAYQEIERIERLLSSHKPESEITRINQHAGAKHVRVSYETFAIVTRAVAYSRKFAGDFDITIGPVTELWGFNGDREVTVPEPRLLKNLLNLVNFHNIVLSRQDTTVFLKKTGMKLDLGGIAKGYAIDRAAFVLNQNGIQNFLINAGGDIYACGTKYGHQKWTVGLQHPRKQAELLATFEAQDVAVATSGDYERYKLINGKRYHHLIDPHTGFPADQNQSVTVFAPSAEQADVWATYLFIAGAKHDLKAMQRHPVRAIFVRAAGDIVCDEALRKEFGVVFLN